MGWRYGDGRKGREWRGYRKDIYDVRTSTKTFWVLGVNIRIFEYIVREELRG